MQKISNTYILILLLCFSYGGVLQAQDVKVKAGFLRDTIRLGDQVDYFLVARYPSQLTVLFPDSVHSFDPFEFYRKHYFPTQTIQGESCDSVVYRLYSFDVADIQYLTLPVFVVNARDCTMYVPLRDSVFLKSVLEGAVPDSVSAQDLPLKTNTLYQKVATLFNYPILLITLGSLLGISILVWIFFGKRIRKYFKLKTLNKNHSKFIETYTHYLTQLKTKFTPQQTEVTLSHWKKYLEQLEKVPYTKLTTRETIKLEKDDKLGESLHTLDRAIYGNHTTVMEPLVYLQRVADKRFSKKLEEVKHG